MMVKIEERQNHGENEAEKIFIDKMKGKMEDRQNFGQNGEQRE